MRILSSRLQLARKCVPADVCGSRLRVRNLVIVPAHVREVYMAGSVDGPPFLPKRDGLVANSQGHENKRDCARSE